MRALWLFIYIVSALASAHTEPGMQLHVEMNLAGGRKILLSDGSLWEIDPSDLPISALWLSPSPLEVLPGGSNTYPYVLIDILTHTKVKAKPVATAASHLIRPLSSYD